MSEGARLQVAADFALPLEAVTQTFAILAKRGAGKTYAGAVMVEEMLAAEQQVVVVDPVGVWWGLRVDASGSGPGLPIIVMGGDYGDVPITPDDGQMVARVAVETRRSFVVDLSGFRKGEQARFMTAFAEALYHQNRAPLHLVLDEADAFAPQRPLKGTERLLGAIEDIVRRGRARGLGVTLITQRAAVLNKNVLTQIEVLVTLRTIGPQDLAAIDDWIKLHGTPGQRAELMESLPSLPIGAAWIWSPAWLDVFQKVTIRRKRTFDSSATPEVGAALARFDILPLRDFDTLQALADHYGLGRQEAEAEATPARTATSDVKRLRARVAELERQLAVQVASQVERVEVPALSDEQLEWLQELAGTFLTAAQEIMAALDRVRSVAVKPGGRVALGTTPARDVRVAYGPGARPWEPLPDDAPELKAGARTILSTLASRHPAKYTRTQLGTLAGYTASGGTFSAYWGALKRAGLVAEDGTGVWVTDKGREYVGDQGARQIDTPYDLFQMWCEVLRAGEAKMLDVLYDAHPDWLTREQLGEIAGYTASGGTFSQYLGTLRRNGLIETNGQSVRLNVKALEPGGD